MICCFLNNEEIDFQISFKKSFLYRVPVSDLFCFVIQALCEKGLMGMENSHRRIIAELEDKHRKELEALRIEKEQALTEETQATLAGE